MPRWLKFGLVGCGGLIAIIILFAACAAIVAQNPPATTPPAAPPAAPEKEEAKEETPKAEPAPEKKEEAKKADADTVLVRVAGAPGTAFQGSYGTPDSLRSVDGVAPEEFEVEVETGFMSMDIVSATMQKQGQGSEELTVEIVADGEVVKQQSTTAPFGVVSLSANPTELQGS